MTRALVFGLALACAVFAGRGIEIAQAKEAPPKQWRYRECRFQGLERPIWTPLEERITARCAVGKWPVPGGLTKFIQVGTCESGWNRLASNGGRYLGLFQHAKAYWPGRVASLDPDWWDKDLNRRWQNSRAQIVVTARMAHAGGWGPWSCAA